MPSLRNVVRLIPVALVLAASPAGAARRAPVGETRPDITRPAARAVRAADAEAQIALTRGEAWRDFVSRHGDWSVIWNEVTGTPHRAFGAGIRLAGFSDDPGGVDRAVRGFVGRNAALLRGTPTLETVDVHRGGNVWYARYRQTVDGVPLLFADWEFRVGLNGNLAAFGADAHHPPPDVNTTPTIVPAVAREAAKAGLAFNPATDRVEGQDLYLLPYVVEGRTEYRLVYDVRVFIHRPRGNWVTLVDATTGEVLWRHDRVRHSTVTGNVNGRIHPRTVNDALVTRNFANLTVRVGTTDVVTNANGNYTAGCTGTSPVTAKLQGPYVRIVRQFCDNQLPPPPPCDATFLGSAGCPGSRNIDWTSGSRSSERNAFYHANAAHDYLKGLDPSYAASDWQIQLDVDSVDDDCSAFWDGFTITFGLESSECPNIATIPDVVYHEYGHRVNDDLYFARGSTFGMVNLALHEAAADLLAAFVLDDPVIGEGFFGSGTFLKDLRTMRRWPEDRTPEPNEQSLVLSGAYWDLRQSLGLATTQRLVHFAKYGLPDDPDDGVAMSEYFVETLVADDNDADLSNGTPNMNQIIAAFNAHGIGTNYFLNIAHTPLDDQPTGGPYPVTAVIQYTGPVGSLDIGSPRLFFKVNDLPYDSRPMFPTGNPDEWGAEVPSQSGAIVRYYIRAAETNGGVKTEPAGAPSRKEHVFVAGPASAIYSTDLEADPGWTVGAPGDNATTGIWVRVDPVGTIAQPEDDHTPAGVNCFVTGNAAPGDFPGVNDVDDGKTTLLTRIFDATAGGGTFPIVSYYRWYSNNTGEAPGSDFWRVDISNNGGATWTSVENTTQTDMSWRRVVFFIRDYVTPTNNMRMRFIAADEGQPSLVEAAVDDFDLLAFAAQVSVGDAERPGALTLAPPSPNPFRTATRLRYTLPAAGAVSLAVFDIHGRSVRTLAAGAQAAGPHAVEWDGRDDDGRRLPSGPYFVRLGHGGGRSTQAVVRIE